MTRKELDALVDGMSEAIKVSVFDPLNARLKKLEAAPAVRYCGVWRADRTYSAGALVTRSGGLWLATCDTGQTPGDGGDFKLIVKSGSAV
jgi:hypothetical protein